MGATSLAPTEYVQVKKFERQHALVSEYLAVTSDSNSGATVALFLSLMSQSMQVMPSLYEEMHSMNKEIQAMNEKMNALPSLSNEIKDMNRHIYNISRNLDKTMGAAGRLMPW